MIGLCCEYLSVRFIWLYVVIMSRTRFRVHPHPIVARMSRNSFLETGAKSEVWTDCNGTWTHNYLVRKRILILAKWLSVHLWTKCCGFEVRGSLQSLQTSDLAPVSSKEFLDIQAAIECGFTLKRVRDMITTYSQCLSCYILLTDQISMSDCLYFVRYWEICVL